VQRVLSRALRVRKARVGEFELRLQPRQAGLELGRLDLQVSVLEVRPSESLEALARQLELPSRLLERRAADRALRRRGRDRLLAADDLVLERGPGRGSVAGVGCGR
jgi:hypothetical protein